MKNPEQSREGTIGFAMNTCTASDRMCWTPKDAHFTATNRAPLTPKAFDVLLFLAQNPKPVDHKDELLKRWGDAFVERET